jgi:1L-myo-inositol 1-phosphate cytidylyltransferase / CDP-L-myo-inositol myo-inositolphosphotransferase
LPQILIVFADATTAEYRVAGIPAAARAAHAIASLKDSGEIDGCAIGADTGWFPSEDVRTECARLAPRLQTVFSAAAIDDDAIVIRGERFVAAAARHPGDPRREGVLPALFEAAVKSRARLQAPSADADVAMRELRRTGRHLLRMTGKSSDGVVSRYINRPISRAISWQLLKVSGLKPLHASIGTAVIAIAMALALLLGDWPGLILGAILFQAASIFDGVDGEMARATCRTSSQGATIDSIIDACTNLAFIAGVTINVGLAGDLIGAVAGGLALATLAAGLFLISSRASAAGEPVNFETVKKHLRRDGPPNRVVEWLIHLTMRDFFAAACAVMILLGLTHQLLLLFATVSLGWLVVTAVVLRRIAPSAPSSPREPRPALLIETPRWR